MAARPVESTVREHTESNMAYIPPIKKRHYINALSNERDGKIIAHSCSKCREEYPVKAPGIWFERADQRDVWCWVCKPCLDKRGIRCP